MQANTKAERERLAAEKAEKEVPKVVELDDEAYQNTLIDTMPKESGGKPPEETNEKEELEIDEG